MALVSTAIGSATISASFSCSRIYSGIYSHGETGPWPANLEQPLRAEVCETPVCSMFHLPEWTRKKNRFSFACQQHKTSWLIRAHIIDIYTRARICYHSTLIQPVYCRCITMLSTPEDVLKAMGAWAVYVGVLCVSVYVTALCLSGRGIASTQQLGSSNGEKRSKYSQNP